MPIKNVVAVGDAKLAQVLDLVVDEITRAQAKFKHYNSMHEAKAVIEEEFEEFWDEVKANKEPGADYRQIQELTQVAATAIRAMIDLGHPAIIESETRRRFGYPS